MTYEDITRFMTTKKVEGNEVKINFKTRNSLRGIFIRQPDFEELSRKNLWRIVSETHISDFLKTGDKNLAKIFNGSEFTKLELV